MFRFVLKETRGGRATTRLLIKKAGVPAKARKTKVELRYVSKGRKKDTLRLTHLLGSLWCLRI